MVYNIDVLRYCINNGLHYPFGKFSDYKYENLFGDDNNWKIDSIIFDINKSEYILNIYYGKTKEKYLFRHKTVRMISLSDYLLVERMMKLNKIINHE